MNQLPTVGLRASSQLLLLALLACSNPESASDDDGSSGRVGGSAGSGGSGQVGGAPQSGGGPANGGATVGGAVGGGGRAAGGASGVAGDQSVAGSGGLAGSGGGGAMAGALNGGEAGAGGGSGSLTGGMAGAGGSTSGAGGSGGSTASECNAVLAVAEMRLGWNLGNSLDAADATKSDTVVETAWGNPAITPELMSTVASSGFGAVRIPVTWIGRFGAAPDYAINAAFINRVEEVVNYALDLDLYVIINVHHDGAEGVTGQWLSLVDGSGQVTPANTSAVLAQFTTIWEQIAAHFEDYGDHLIFESMNEVKVGYDPPLQSYYDQINALNQAFVDTIRGSAGYNPQRCLVVPGYNTNIEFTVAGFQKPNDNSPGKLILSDHYYDPWSFAGEASSHGWGTGNPGADNWGQEDWVQSQVAKLKTTFIDQGLPMIWGEYGAVQQDGYENYRRYYMEYVTKAVHDAGIVPFVWDNGATGSGAEAFGLFDRSNDTVAYPPILEAMTRAVTSSYELSDIAKP